MTTSNSQEMTYRERNPLVAPRYSKFLVGDIINILSANSNYNQERLLRTINTNINTYKNSGDINIYSALVMLKTYITSFGYEACRHLQYLRKLIETQGQQLHNRHLLDHIAIIFYNEEPRDEYEVYSLNSFIDGIIEIILDNTFRVINDIWALEDTITAWFQGIELNPLPENIPEQEIQDVATPEEIEMTRDIDNWPSWSVVERPSAQELLPYEPEPQGCCSKCCIIM